MGTWLDPATAVRAATVVLALTGTLITAPGAVPWLRRRAKHATRTVGKGLVWVRHFGHPPLPKRGPTIALTGEPATLDIRTVGGEVDYWHPDPAQQIEILRRKVASLRRRHDDLRKEHGQRLRKVEHAIAVARHEHLQALTKLEAKAERERHRESEVNGRGVPLLGFAAVLSAIPDSVSNGHPVIGWGLVSMSALLLLLVVPGARRAGLTST